MGVARLPSGPQHDLLGEVNVNHTQPSDVIRRLRQRLGLTQEEFAHEIAVTVSTVNRWENAHAVPSKLAWKVIRDLARRRGLTDQLQLPHAVAGGR
jgi:DNA-binding transcriptional regulator YiaG